MPADKNALSFLMPVTREKPWAGVLAIITLALLLGASDLRAAAECSNTPAAGNWIECIEGTASTDNININASSIDIDTSSDNVPGVKASHSGNGNIDINITGTTETPSTIDTAGDRSQGISFELFQNVNGTGSVTLENTQITTQGEEARGVYGTHHGIGAVTVDLNPGVVIETSGFRADGVTFTQINRSATEDATLEAQGIRVTVRGNEASGLLAQQYGLGEVVVDVRDSTIVAQGNFGIGIEGYRNDSSGDIDIDVVGGSSTTGGYFGHGIRAWHDDVGGAATDTGNLEITTRNHAIETQGTAHHPTFGSTFAYGIYANNENTGNIVIDMQEGSSVITQGKNSHGIVAYQRNATNPGSIDITVNGPVTVHGADAQGVRVGTVNSSGVPSRMAPLDSDGYRQQSVTVNGSITSTGEGVFLANGGKVIIGREGSINSSSGIAILATGTVPEDTTDQNNPIAAIPPKLRVDFNREGRQVALAIGDGWILNDGGETTIAVNGTVLHDGETGATGETAANGVWDVTMLEDGVTVTDRSNADPAQWTVSTRAANVITDRDFSVTDFTETRRPPPRLPRPPRPPPEPEPQVHEVNEAVSVGAEAAAGVHVEGDGEVHIGAQGSLRADSGIAILATGDTPELLVDMDLDGRRVMEVIGDDWIINDGGETTIVVNDVKLHDGRTGTVTELNPETDMQVPVTVANGVWDMSVRAEGVTVTDRSDPDPANWVISDLAEGVITDRDFSVEDFIETREEPEPEPEPTQPPMLIEEYAPRAAVYEALPDVLLGLHARTPTAPRTAPVWFTVSGRTGSRDFDRSTVGIEVDTDYLEAEIGKHVPLEGDFDAWAALHYLTGTAEVDSPVQGGDIDVQGFGASLEVRWSQAGHSYVSGQASLMNYDLDLDSDKRGRLKSGVDAYAWALRLEAGRHLQRGAVQLSPRIRLEHASVSVDRFTDAVGARVSYPDEDRLTAALGVLAETGHDARKDGLSLWGSLDVDYTLDGARTTARVSGEKLSAEAGDSSVQLGAGGTWRRDNLMVNAGLSAREALDSGSEEYGATLSLGLQF